jgi:hypothetical protein
VRAAVMEAGGSDADRKLLDDLYRWKKERQLQEGAFVRVLDLLARIDPPGAKKLRSLFWSHDGAKQVRAVITASDWVQGADSLELGFLTCDPATPSPSGYRHLRASRLPVIRKNPQVAKALDDFKAWATRHGHDKWVVHSCLQRALSPLVSQVRTRGLMPGWDDLGELDQLRFVKLSLERERLMLGPRPLHIRAMELFPSPAAAKMEAKGWPKSRERTTPPTRVHCEKCDQFYNLSLLQRSCRWCGAPPPPVCRHGSVTHPPALFENPSALPNNTSRGTPGHRGPQRQWVVRSGRTREASPTRGPILTEGYRTVISGREPSDPAPLRPRD